MKRQEIVQQAGREIELLSRLHIIYGLKDEPCFAAQKKKIVDLITDGNINVKRISILFPSICIADTSGNRQSITCCGECCHTGKRAQAFSRLLTSFSWVAGCMKPCSPRFI